MADPVLAAVRPTFRAVARTFVPAAEWLGADEWAELERIVEEALASRPAAMRRQLVLFVRVLDLMALLRYRRRLPRLDAVRRARLLAAVQDAPVLLLRRGLWGLRTLVFMGYYARPAAAAEIGYRAHLRGWSGRAGPVRDPGAQGSGAPPVAAPGA